MIERLYIQNFRCFESFTLDLAGCTSALLIGKNGVGKSTVRDALSILQMIGRGVSRADLLISEKDFSQHRTDRPIRFEIELKLPANRFKYIVAFEWYSGDDFAGILEEGLWVDAEMVFKRELAEIQLTGGSTRSCATTRMIADACWRSSSQYSSALEQVALHTAQKLAANSAMCSGTG